MYIQSYFNTAKSLIGQYDGKTPFAQYLKQHFAQNKKYGSRDRKQIAHICFCYFRLANALTSITIEDQMKAAIFVCNDSPEYQPVLPEEWHSHMDKSPEEKLALIKKVYPSFDEQSIFPFSSALSENIEVQPFILSHLSQPDLYVRVRPGKMPQVTAKLQKADVSFENVGDSCLRLANTTPVNQLLEIDKEVVIQDWASQQIAEYLAIAKDNLKKGGVNALDCCAASGGKSILAYDTFTNISLTVSDIRPSIIRNLRARFHTAGINRYLCTVADLTDASGTIRNAPFDLVICDAPCTGSGTWGRTPERLCFFKEEEIAHYTHLQKTIALNALKHLSAQGYFLYITCSVFSKENEEVVEHILQHSGLQLIGNKLIKGYDKKADSMFMALFCNNPRKPE